MSLINQKTSRVRFANELDSKNEENNDLENLQLKIYREKRNRLGRRNG